MPGIDFKAIRNTISIADVLDKIGWRGRTCYSGETRGPCPIHGQRSARSRSFAVDLKRSVWFCHGCKRGGDVIDLWAALHGLATYEAALQLCESFMVHVPRLHVHFPWQAGTEKRNGRLPFLPPADVN